MCVFSAMLTGFYLVVRSSNLVPSSTEMFNAKEQLTRWHVSIDPDQELVIFLIEWSKNNQNFKRELWVLVKAAKDKDVCLIHNLSQYFKLVQVLDCAPCFSYYNDRKELKALTYKQLNEQIKDWVGKIGREGASYTMHCLRRGGQIML